MRCGPFLLLIIPVFSYWSLVIECLNYAKDCPLDERTKESNSYADIHGPLRLRVIYYSAKSFNDGLKLCKTCVNGEMSTFASKLRELRSGDYPHYLGIYRPANDTQWKWASNNSVVEDWVNVTARLDNVNKMQPGVSYGIIVKDSNSEIGKSLSSSDRTFWSVVPIDERFDNLKKLYFGMDLIRFVRLVCQYPARRACSYANVTEPNCTYTKNYGCHKHTLTIVYDDINVTCSGPEHISFAQQCDNSECGVCQVSPWSEWSKCSAKFCKDGIGNKRRAREIDTNSCQDGYFNNYELEQKQNCTPFGCDKLRDRYEIS